MAGGSRKHSIDIAPRMRTAFYQGLLEACERKKMSLEEFCAEWWIEDKKGAADTLSKFLPRENKVSGKVEHEHNHKHVAISEITGFLEEAIGPIENSDNAVSGKDGPILPPPLRTQ